MINKNKTTTIVMSQELFDSAKKKAYGIGTNVSTYVRMLIIKDLNEADKK